VAIERFPKESLKFKALEHVIIGKSREHLFSFFFSFFWLTLLLKLLLVSCFFFLALFVQDGFAKLSAAFSFKVY